MTPVQERSLHVVLDAAHEQLKDLRKYDEGKAGLKGFLIELEDSIDSLNRMLAEHDKQRKEAKCT